MSEREREKKHSQKSQHYNGIINKNIFVESDENDNKMPLPQTQEYKHIFQHIIQSKYRG